MKTYLVGGAVRDILIGRTPREHDIAFEASVAHFLQANPSARKVGKRIDVYLIGNVEHRPVQGGDIRADLLQRDFTINALALEADGTLHAHPDALADLRASIIRPASPGALMTDPVRVLRAARFAAQLPEMSLAQETLEAMRAVAAAGHLAEMPCEQVCRETLKALGSPAPERFFISLAKGGCLQPWFAEVADLTGVPAGPPAYHTGSAFDHTNDIMRRLAGDAFDVWLGLCHDLGKGTTPADILPRHLGHEHRGEEAATALGQRLGMSNRFIRGGALAARMHMKAGRYDTLRPHTRVDLLLVLHHAGITRNVWNLVTADSGIDHTATAMAELETILAVKLPPSLRGKGPESGRMLREMQCMALAARRTEPDGASGEKCPGGPA